MQLADSVEQAARGMVKAAFVCSSQCCRSVGDGGERPLSGQLAAAGRVPADGLTGCNSAGRQQGRVGTALHAVSGKSDFDHTAAFRFLLNVCREVPRHAASRACLFTPAAATCDEIKAARQARATSRRAASRGWPTGIAAAPAALLPAVPAAALPPAAAAAVPQCRGAGKQGCCSAILAEWLAVPASRRQQIQRTWHALRPAAWSAQQLRPC